MIITAFTLGILNLCFNVFLFLYVFGIIKLGEETDDDKYSKYRTSNGLLSRKKINVEDE